MNKILITSIIIMFTFNGCFFKQSYIMYPILPEYKKPTISFPKQIKDEDDKAKIVDAAWKLDKYSTKLITVIKTYNGFARMKNEKIEKIANQ